MIANENHHGLPTVGSGNFQLQEGWIARHWKTVTTVEIEGVMVVEQVIIPHAIEVGVWSSMHHLRLQGTVAAKMSFEEPMTGVATSKDYLLLLIHHNHHLMGAILTIGGEGHEIVAMIVEDTIRTKKRGKIWSDVFPC